LATKSRTKQKEAVVFWFRRDLRLTDNAGLYHALKESKNVLPIFVFDKNILGDLKNKSDARVDFIHSALSNIQEQLIQIGSSLRVLYDTPEQAIKKIFTEFKITAVYANHDYEPYAIARDEKIKLLVNSYGAEFKTFKDQCVFEKNEVLKDNGDPYIVFTPYSRKWKQLLVEKPIEKFSTEERFSNFYKSSPFYFPSLEDVGFVKTKDSFTFKPTVSNELLYKYKEQRDYPFINGTSRLSVHLRFGTVSVRSLALQALHTSETWLNELIWREFYMMILFHFPHVVNGAFRKEYNFMEWDNNEEYFEKWKAGQTGFPLVDAGMRELLHTGFMHNRVRMAVSSFLVKDLFINWQWGEAWFAEKLLDFDLSANNGGWQWSAGTGCDAAPYFRIFNPTEQQKKFDPDFRYIKKWLPEFGSHQYPQPLVDHSLARKKTLERYKACLSMR